MADRHHDLEATVARYVASNDSRRTRRTASSRPPQNYAPLRVRALVGAVGCLLMIGFFPVVWGYEYLFRSHRVSIVVQSNDSTPICRRVYLGHGYAIDEDRRVSERHHCGLIHTNYGAFRLPETHIFDVLDTPRERLQKSLLPGCRYDVRIVGPRQRPRPTSRINPMGSGKISVVYRNLGCGVEIGATP